MTAEIYASTDWRTFERQDDDLPYARDVLQGDDDQVRVYRRVDPEYLSWLYRRWRSQCPDSIPAADCLLRLWRFACAQWTATQLRLAHTVAPRPDYAPPAPPTTVAVPRMTDKTTHSVGNVNRLNYITTAPRRHATPMGPPQEPRGEGSAANQVGFSGGFDSGDASGRGAA